MYYGNGTDISCFPFPLALGRNRLLIGSCSWRRTVSLIFSDWNNLCIVGIETRFFALFAHWPRSVNSKCTHVVVMEESCEL